MSTNAWPCTQVAPILSWSEFQKLCHSTRHIVVTQYKLFSVRTPGSAAASPSPSGPAGAPAHRPLGAASLAPLFQAWPTPPSLAVPSRTPLPRRAKDLAAGAVQGRGRSGAPRIHPSPAVPVPVHPPGAVSSLLFPRRCPPPPPGRGSHGCSGPDAPPPPLNLISTAVPVPLPPTPGLGSRGCSRPGPSRPAAVPARGPPPRGRRAPWARRCEDAAGGGATRNSRLPRLRRRSPSRASKIACAILEPPPPREPKRGYASIVGAAAAAGSGPPGGAREPPPSPPFRKPSHGSRDPQHPGSPLAPP